MIPVNFLLVIAMIMFVLGVIGVVVKRNVFIILMSIELMLNSANLVFVTFSRYFGNLDGQVIALLVMTLAAAEVSVGLGILVAVYRTHKTVLIDEINTLKH